jgi:hypothetical protein
LVYLMLKHNARQSNTLFSLLPSKIGFSLKYI